MGRGIWIPTLPTNNTPRMVQGPCLSVPRPDDHPIHDINSLQQISGMRADDIQSTAGHITVFVRLIGPLMPLSSRPRNPITPDPPGPISTCKVDRTYKSMRVCSSHSHTRPTTSPNENSNRPHHSSSSSSSRSQPPLPDHHHLGGPLVRQRGKKKQSSSNRDRQLPTTQPPTTSPSLSPWG